MDVRLRSLGCVGRLGGVLSLGLLPLVLRKHENQFPLRLEGDSMILRSGARIPWSAFTRVRATEILLNGRYQHTLYELWHPGGRIHFPSHRIEDAESVVKFVMAHLSPNVQRG